MAQMTTRRTTRQARPLSRRTFLRGVLAGAAISVALPPLELFFDSNGVAYADGSGFPRRFGLFFWGNGTLPDRWVPQGTGKDWVTSPQLAPLQPMRDHLSVVTGLEVKVVNAVAHHSGPAGFLTGTDSLDKGNNDHTFLAPSLDQILAAEIGGETQYRSLEIGVQPGMSGLSFNGKDSKNPPETDPAALFERLFGPEFRAPGEDPIIDPRLALRRSVLDGVMADADRLKARLGAQDKTRLDQHFAAVRDLELRLQRLEEDPPNLAACSRPTEPAPIPDIDGRPQVSVRARVMADLLVMAYACDLTRVASYWYSDPLSDVLYPGATAGHHQLTHDEPGDQPKVNEIITATMGDLNYLLEQLQAVPEGAGTLLDHSVILATSDVSYGRTHQIDEYPIVLAGGGSGALKPGVHYRSASKENAGKVPLTVLRAMGVAVEAFGTGDAKSDQGLSAVEA